MNLLEQCKLITLSDHKSSSKARILGEKFLSSGLTESSEEIKPFLLKAENSTIAKYIYISGTFTQRLS